MSLIQNDHVIEQLTPDGAYQSLGVCVLPGRCRRGHDCLYSQSTQFPAHLLAINRIAVSQPIARRRLEWERLDKLLRRPLGGWMLGHVEVKHAASICLTHPEMFSGVASFSAAMQIANSPAWSGIDMKATLGAHAPPVWSRYLHDGAPQLF